MQLESFVLLSSVEEQNLRDHYFNFVVSNPNLFGAFLSEHGTAVSYLAGYSIAYKDYVSMVSQVGVVAWRVRFGYDSRAVGSAPFRLICSGIDSTGRVLTPNYQLVPEIGMVPNTSFHTWPHEMAVPDELVTPWLEAWENLLQCNQVPSSLCYTQFGLLRGYNFSSDDFLNVMSSVDPGQADNHFINFYLVNHSRPAGADKTEQVHIPGTLGVMLVLEKQENGVSKAISSFYDISSPCPPTC